MSIAVLTHHVSVLDDGGMTRRRTTPARPACLPVGLPAPAPHIDRRSCMFCPDVVLQARPTANRAEWEYFDVATGLSYVDNTPPELRADPAKWWADLARERPGTYSVLIAAQATGQHSWWHHHIPGASLPGQPVNTSVPYCCSQPMWASPDGWVCRDAGYRSQPRPYTEGGPDELE